ncbi:hypothetical protein BH10ACI1_BH10ACI1_22610 [soil metagenome]
MTLALTLVLVNSCSNIKTAVSKLTDKNQVKSKFKPMDIPKDIENSTADEHSSEENTVIISQSDGTNFFIGEDDYPLEVVTEKLESLFKKNPSEKQLIYLNASGYTEFGDIVKLLAAVRKTNVENVGLWVLPKVKNETGFNILKVKIPAEPKDSDLNTKPNPMTLVVVIQKDGKFKLNNEIVSADFLRLRLKQVFKDRETNVVFRQGTNDIEKTVTVKSSKSIKYGEVVKLIDTVTGAGASPVILQIDDLEQ